MGDGRHWHFKQRGTSPITEIFPIASTGENVVVSSFDDRCGRKVRAEPGLLLLIHRSWPLRAGNYAATVSVSIRKTRTRGGQIQMTITGLNPGTHTLLTYHNAGDAPSALGTLAPINVYLNGVFVTAVAPSIRTNDLNTPTVYLNFTTASTNDVTTVLFAADTFNRRDHQEYFPERI